MNQFPKALMFAGKEPFPTIYVDSQKEEEVGLHLPFCISWFLFCHIVYNIHRKWFGLIVLLKRVLTHWINLSILVIVFLLLPCFSGGQWFLRHKWRMQRRPLTVSRWRMMPKKRRRCVLLFSSHQLLLELYKTCSSIFVSNHVFILPRQWQPGLEHLCFGLSVWSRLTSITWINMKPSHVVIKVE